jgi:hypothetical protein
MLKTSAMSNSMVVEHSTHYHNFEGWNPANAGTAREKIVKRFNLNQRYSVQQKYFKIEDHSLKAALRLWPVL